jgi:hypothetical protein
MVMACITWSWRASHGHGVHHMVMACITWSWRASIGQHSSPLHKYVPSETPKHHTNLIVF